MALPGELRLRGRKGFEAFRREAISYFESDIALKIKTCESGERHFAIIIPKRVGGAVRRNRTRRVLSEWIRTNLDAFPDGKDYLIIVRRVGEGGGKALLGSLSRLAKRASNE